MFFYLFNFFVDDIEIIGVLEIYCRLWRGLEVWVLRYLGEGDLVVFWKWGFWNVNEVSCEINLKFSGGWEKRLISIAREVDCSR